MRRWLGIADTEYTSKDGWNNFKKKVLISCQQALAQYFSIYLSKINARDPSTRAVRFNLNEFQRIMEFGKLNIGQLKDTTDSLLQKIVHVPTGNGGYTAFQLFKECTVDQNDETGEWFVEIDAHDKALPLMFDFSAIINPIIVIITSKINFFSSRFILFISFSSPLSSRRAVPANSFSFRAAQQLHPLIQTLLLDQHSPALMPVPG